MMHIRRPTVFLRIATSLVVGFLLVPAVAFAQTAPAEKCTSEGATRDRPTTIDLGIEKSDCTLPVYASNPKLKSDCEKGNAEIDALKLKNTTEKATVKQICKNGIWTNIVPGESVSLFCFTQDECTSPQYGGSLDRFIPGQGCPAKFGKCLAPEPVMTLSSPILGQTSVQGFRSYVLLMFNYMLNIVVIVAAVMFVYGGFRYIVGSSFGDIKAAKERMVNATIGLILAFSAVILLQTVNPATLKLDAVKVYLIKRIEFSLVNRCDLFKPKDGKEVKFSDAGEPAGSIPFDPDASKFTLAGVDTQCGRKYYIQGTAGQTCSGNVCSGENAKRTCSSCSGLSSSVVPLCAGKERACLKIPFGGTIGWTDSTYPTEVFLVPVCYNASPGYKAGVGRIVPSQSSDVGDEIPDYIYAGTIFNTSKNDAGDTTYSFPMTDRSLLDELSNACKDKGGPNGVVLAVRYHDNCGWQQALTAAGGTASGVTGAAALAGECKLSPDDLVIVSKQDCTGAYFQNESYQPYFSGYAMGGVTVTNHDMFTNAIWCGWTTKPYVGSYNIKQKRVVGILEPNKRTRFNWNGNPQQNPYWSFKDLEKAQNGDTPIECSFNLTAQTAPRNPNMILFGGCTVDWKGIKDEGPTGMPDTSNVPSFMPSDIIDFYLGK